MSNSDTPPNFNPNSHNAMFATILGRLEEQNRNSEAHRHDVIQRLGVIQEQVTKTNGRVTRLEQWRASQKAQVALASSLFGGAAALIGWLISQYLAGKGIK